MALTTHQSLGQAKANEPKQADVSLTSGKHPNHKPQIIVGTSKGLWFLGVEQQVEFEGHSITALAPSPEGLWAVVNHDSVWHQDLHGKWHEVASVNDLELNCILPADGAVLVGTSEAHLLRIIDDSVETIEGFESVEGREDWYTPWGGPPDVRSLAVGQSGELYVNVHVGGILRSDDQGRSWRPTIDLHSDVHEVRTVIDHPGLVLAATAEGLATSLDAGDSWRFDQANLHAVYSRAVAVSGKTVLMSASLGPRGGRAALYQHSLAEPGPFKKCEQGLPEWFPSNINTGSLATLGDMAAFGTREGQIFTSSDAGLTWKQAASGLASIHCLSLI